MTGSTLQVSSIDEFNSTNVVLDAQGTSAAIPIGSTGNVDLTLADDCFLTGIEVVSDGGAFGDALSLQVLAGATVLGTFASGWVVGMDGLQVSHDSSYPAKILAGMTIRVIYQSKAIGIGNVNVAANYILHKALI